MNPTRTSTAEPQQVASPHAPVKSEPARWAKVVVGLPDRIVMLLFWTALVVAVCVLCSQFRPFVVLPLLVVVVVATWRLTPAAITVTRAHLVSSFAALGTVVVWLGVNIPFASQFITVWRDPGFLTLEGLWLSGHASPNIPVGAARAVDLGFQDVTAATGAYEMVGGSLQVQGAKLLPGMLGLAGWAGGEHAVMRANLLIGAVGLLAVFALARRVVRPAFSLVPVVALALSMPMVVFSRAAYTEPLALALVFGGLTMAWSAIETRSSPRYLVAGAMIGATALVRIDGAASVVGLVVGIGLTAAAAVPPRTRRRQLVAVGLVAGGALSMVLLGYLDLRLYSEGYLFDHYQQFTSLIAVLVVAVVGVVVLGMLYRLDPARRWVLAHKPRLANAAAAAVVVVAVFLASRPLWMVNHHVPAHSGYSAHVASLQEKAGMVLDPTRSYDESSLSWHAWYYGWPMVVLAVIGLAVVLHRVVAKRDPRLALVFGVVVAPSLLYLWVVNITPDQIWAMRRFLPVTIPGFLLAAAVTLDALWSRRSSWAAPAAAVVGAVVVALFPALTWGPAAVSIEQDGRLPEAHTVCDAVGDDPVVYVHAGEAPPYLATLRTMCDVQVIQALTTLSTADLVALKEAWGDQEVKLVTFDPYNVPWPDGVVPDPLRTTTITAWHERLQRIPYRAGRTTSRLWVATIGADGALTPVDPDEVTSGTAAP
ncbi:hypothetical protein [Cellulomonas sp. URHD0024]|uniref:hypothetical protein n=1 Tax=Cellulomonas sp. URHD0024 TaxID=1302620 RepID=UPI0004119F7B|nr:hypothetical protein [Cellulomonas sp. URHD0024]